MELSIENLPYLCLLWVGLGFIIILIGVFIIAYMRFDTSEYTQYVSQNNAVELKVNNEEYFEKILQDKEKKSNKVKKDKTNETEIYSSIKALHLKGKTEEEIAKNLNVGVGEVQLILSLYKMR